MLGYRGSKLDVGLHLHSPRNGPPRTRTRCRIDLRKNRRFAADFAPRRSSFRVLSAALTTPTLRPRPTQADSARDCTQRAQRFGVWATSPSPAARPRGSVNESATRSRRFQGREVLVRRVRPSRRLDGGCQRAKAAWQFRRSLVLSETCIGPTGRNASPQTIYGSSADETFATPVAGESSNSRPKAATGSAHPG